MSGSIDELMSGIATMVVHVKLSSKVKELAPKVPMRLNECNPRNDYDLGMSGENVRRTLVRFTYNAQIRVLNDSFGKKRLSNG